MLNLNPYSGSTLAFHKSKAYEHHLNLMESAQKSIYINDIEISNSADFIADKAIVLLHLSQNVNPEDFKITKCNAKVDAQVYPNGIIQLNFNDIELKPSETLQCTYRFKLASSDIKQEALVKKTYLFFFQ